MMKNIFTVLTISMFTIFVQTVFAQNNLQFGMHAGLNAAGFSGDEIDYESRIGFMAGFSVEIPLEDQIFNIETGAYYSQKGAKGVYREPIEFPCCNAGNTGTLKTDYIDIPILVKFDYERSGSFHPQLVAGPYLAVNIGAKASEADNLYIENIDELVRTVDFGLMIGGGGVLQRESLNIRLRASYSFGFASVFDSEIEGDEKHRVFSITAGIIF